MFVRSGHMRCCEKNLQKMTSTWSQEMSSDYLLTCLICTLEPNFLTCKHHGIFLKKSLWSEVLNCVALVLNPIYTSSNGSHCDQLHWAPFFGLRRLGRCRLHRIASSIRLWRLWIDSTIRWLHDFYSLPSQVKFQDPPDGFVPVLEPNCLFPCQTSLATNQLWPLTSEKRIPEHQKPFANNIHLVKHDSWFSTSQQFENSTRIDCVQFLLGFYQSSLESLKKSKRTGRKRSGMDIRWLCNGFHLGFAIGVFCVSLDFSDSQ